MLQEAGVGDVHALLGGFAAWVAAGYPVVKGEPPK
jgi:rhodanese-related sulfurtransferase